MWAVFQLTTTVAAPLQGALDALVTGPISAAATGLLDAVGLGDTWVTGLVVDGLIAGVGMLLTFVPLMAIMFALLSLLEDSGYMARAAVVTDRLMRRIGLPGRAFLPLVVGFGCNVPAISGTRVLPDARHRLLTALLVPFTSCSARLTVYVLVATTFFGSQRRHRRLRHVRAVHRARGARWAGDAFDPAAGHGRHPAGAGPAAVPAAAPAVDLGQHLEPAQRLPAHGQRHHRRDRGGRVGAAGDPSGRPATHWRGARPGQLVRNRTAQTLAPAFVPAGFGDVGVRPARSWSGSLPRRPSSRRGRRRTPRRSRCRGRARGCSWVKSIRRTSSRAAEEHTNAAVWAFLVFLLAYTPCVATLAAQKREIGMRWTVFGVGMQLVLAWTLAVAVFQVGRLL